MKVVKVNDKTDLAGKRAAAHSAQAHAEAQAAQAEALMKGLNAFTNFEPGTHRWDVSSNREAREGSANTSG